MLDEAEGWNKPSSASHQARRFHDYGFTSSICTSRRGSLNGVSHPILKPNTLDVTIVDCFVTGSDMARNTELPWLAASGLFAFQDPDYSTRHDDFARHIHPNNIIEAMRLHGSHPGSFCGVHSDKQNLKKESMSLVVGINVFYNAERLGATFYSRVGPESFHNNSERYDPFTQFVIDSYQSLSDNRRRISVDLLKGSSRPGLFQLPIISNPCNLNPTGYHQITLYLMTSLAQQMCLSLPEMVSVVAAYDIIPNNPSYFYVAVVAVLSSTTSSRLLSAHYGYAFGYLIASLMMDFWATKPVKESVPGLRFCHYTKSSVPTGTEWVKQCDEKLGLILHVNATYPLARSKQSRFKVCREVLGRFAKNIPDAGLLITNHSMALMSELGLLPSWIIEHAEIGVSLRYMKWFVERYGLEKPLTFVNIEWMLSTLGSAMHNHFGVVFSVRELENILCKVVRMGVDQPSDRRFCDLLIPRHNLFFTKNSVTIVHPETSESQLIDVSALLNFWIVGNGRMPMTAIVAKFDVPKKIPTEASLLGYVIPKDLFVVNTNRMDEYDLTTTPFMESNERLTRVFSRVSSRLNRW
jgi:hypothetical protein